MRTLIGIIALLGLSLGCDNDKRYVTVNNTSVVETNETVIDCIYEGDAITYVIECKHKHKHVFVDSCPTPPGKE